MHAHARALSSDGQNSPHFIGAPPLKAIVQVVFRFLESVLGCIPFAKAPGGASALRAASIDAAVSVAWVRVRLRVGSDAGFG
jgi:hypothetical protein